MSKSSSPFYLLFRHDLLNSLIEGKIVSNTEKSDLYAREVLVPIKARSVLPQEDSQHYLVQLPQYNDFQALYTNTSLWTAIQTYPDKTNDNCYKIHLGQIKDAKLLRSIKQALQEYCERSGITFDYHQKMNFVTLTLQPKTLESELESALSDIHKIPELQKIIEEYVGPLEDQSGPLEDQSGEVMLVGAENISGV